MKKRYSFVLVFFLCFIGSLSAQTYNWSTQLGGAKTTPIPTEDAIRDIAVDASGNIYVVGYYTAAMTMPIAPLTATNGGLNDIFVAKYNSSGVMQWYQKAGVGQGDKGLSIAVNSAGEVYIAGSFQGSVFFKFAVGGNLASNGANPDMCLVKYNADGTVAWSRGVGGTGPDEAVAVALDPSENPYIAGYISAGTTNVYTEGNFPGPIIGSMTSNGQLDVALIQFTSAGAYTSSMVLGSAAGSERPTQLKIDASGNIYLAGVFFNTVDFDPSGGTSNLTESAPQGSGDAFIAKYTAAGALSWAGSIRGVNSEFVNDLDIDGSGNLYAVGSFSGFENFDLLGGTQTLTSTGLKDIFIAKYNASTGAFISVNKIGGTGDDEANGIHVLSSGDFYVTGSFSGSGIDFDPSAGTTSLTSAGATDAFLAKYNSSIANTWALNIGSANGDIGYAVNLSSDGKIIWAGSFTGAIDVEPGAGVTTLTSVGAEDMFLLSYNDACVGAAITTQPVATQTLCTGHAASFSVVATGTGLTYQWKKGVTALTNGGTISGATSATLNISSLVAGDAGTYTCDVIGCAGTVTSTGSVLTVNAGAAITTQPVATQTLCAGAAASLSVVATGTSLTYQWKKGVTALADGGTISGATTATLNISSLVVGDAGNYTCDVTATGCGAPVTTTVSALIVNTPVAITTHPAATQTLCTGITANFSVVATGSGLTYQWRKGVTNLTDGGTISGATSANLSISSLVIGDAGNYTCVVTGLCGSPVTSTISVLTVNSPVSIVTQPVGSQTLCTGNPASFTVLASGSSLTYQWKLGVTDVTNGGTISGATSANLNISSLVAGDAGNYTCVITGVCGAPATTTVSALTVNAGAAITTQPIVTQTLCEGGAASFSVVATGTGLTYQWRLGATNLTNGGTISGATSATLDISSVVVGDAGNYTCQVTAGGCGSPITSNISVLNVNPMVTITTQPLATQTLCIGATANFAVVVAGSGLTYQWKLGATDVTNGGTISGATSATLTISSLIAGDAGNYTCEVSGTCGPPVTSSISVLSINPAVAITTDPIATQTLCEGTAASFSVVATGTGLTYQWRLGATNLTNGGTISGATSATLNISSLVAADAGNYTCVVSGTCGTPVTSAVSVLNVNSTAMITTDPVASQTLCTGNAASFNVVASGTGLTYQWKLGATNLVDGGTISGATTATLDISSLVAGDAGNYTCEITDLCASTLISAVSVLTVNSGAAITTEPVATQTLCEGSAASFDVIATGTGLSYQWKLGATSLVDGGTISGSTTSTLDISSLVSGDAGNYTCEVTATGCGAPTTSAVSVLNVNSPASITTEPVVSQTLCEGNAASFNVVASGTGLTYQWKLGATNLVDGGTISGATTSTLDISSLVAGDAGNYTCEITDLCASTLISAVSVLTVNSGAVITTDPIATQTLCEGSAASFDVIATGTGLSYQWKLGATSLVDGGTISGATTSTLDISSLVSGDAGNYTCEVTATGCGSPTTSAVSALNVNVPATITTEPVASQTLCEGNAASFDVVATGTGLTYQWKLGVTSLVDGGTISGATTSTLDISSLVAGDAGNYTCEVTAVCGTTEISVVSVLTVNSGAAITTEPIATQTLCEGSAASFDVVATGTGLSYQWKLGATNLVDGGTISGATTSTLDISSLVSGDAGNYTCEVTATGCGAPTTSAVSVLNVNVPASITTEPVASQTLCEGNAASFNVVASGTGLTYQWKLGATNLVDGGTISGATTSTLDISSLVAGDAGNYTCEITDLCASTLISDVSALTVNTGVVITTEPVATQSLCIGASASFNVVATGTGLSYQWKLGTTNLVDGGTISGATASTLDISSLVSGDAGNYTCEVTATGCGAPTTSAVSVLTVNATANIITQPTASQTLCTGSPASISVVALGSGLTYQWKKGAANVVDGGTISGATTSTLLISSLIAGDAGNYTCEIIGSCGATVITNVSVLNVSSGSAFITTQPTDVTGCVGQPVTFDLIATGAGLMYQWKKNGTDLVDGGNVSGATTSSLVLLAATVGDAATYTCVVSSACGAPITSSNAELTVGVSTVVFLQQPVSAVICMNQQAAFFVTATGGISYQWQFKPTAGVYANISDGGGITGANTATLIINNAQFVNRGNYRCIVGSGACSGGSASAAASLSFESPMVISEPLSQSLCNTQTAIFSLVALGNNLSYQWIKNGSAMTNGGKVSGANSATLSISNIDASDDATYYCIVQGLCPPPALSDNVTLFVGFCTDVEEANRENVFTVYPNPSEGVFHVELNRFTGDKLNYDVFNTLGEIVYTGQLEGGGSISSTIDIGEKAAGVYLLRLRYGETQIWERLVLEK